MATRVRIDHSRIYGLALAEVSAARAEGWRLPSRGNIAKALGCARSSLAGNQVIADVFDEDLCQQRTEIIEMAEAMAEEFFGSTLPLGKLALTTLAIRLGINYDAAFVSIKTTHRWYDAIRTAVNTFAAAKRGERPAPQLPEPPVLEAVQCRCCTDYLQLSNINGYNLECWARYQRIVEIDEAWTRRRSA